MSRGKTNSIERYKQLNTIILFVLTLLLGLAFYVPSIRTGFLGQLLMDLGKGLFGFLAYFIPVFFAFITIEYVIGSKRETSKSRRLNVFLLCLFIIALLHTATVNLQLIKDGPIGQFAPSSAARSIINLWKISVDSSVFTIERVLPGGVFGGLLSGAMVSVLGKVVAMISLGLAILFECVIIFNLSVIDIFNKANKVRFTVPQFSFSRNKRGADYAIDEYDDPFVEPEISMPLPIIEKKSESFSIIDKKNFDDPYMDSTFVSLDPDQTDTKNTLNVIGADDQPIASNEKYTLNTGVEVSFITLPKPDKTVFDLKAHPIDEEEIISMDVNELLPEEKDAEILPLKRQPISKITTRHSVPMDEKTKTSPKVRRKPVNPTGEYIFPPLNLLKQPRETNVNKGEDQREVSQRLEATLQSFGVNAKVTKVTRGPVITRFELTPGPGVKVTKILGLSDDIALSLAAPSVRIAPLPEKSAIGVEIPNKTSSPVFLSSLLHERTFSEDQSPLLVALGKNIPGDPIYADISKMPHLLVAGATGSGKSVCINTILMSLLFRASPKEVRLILIDPKVVELKMYNDLPHLLAPVVTDPKKASNTLNWAVKQMDERYNLFASVGARDLKGYNLAMKKSEEETLPYIILVIDELADLMATASKDVENSISRLTAKARAAGIHLIIATQRPSVDVITGVIKANIPSRLAFSVSSGVDSKTILDHTGAEKLLGRGDMLFSPVGSAKPIRGQGAFVSDAEIESVIQYIKEKNPQNFDNQIAEEIVSAKASVSEGVGGSSDDDDDLLESAMEVFLDNNQASTSVLQRRLGIGYPRASRLVDALQDKGYIGAFEGSKPRKVLINREQWDAIRYPSDEKE